MKHVGAIVAAYRSVWGCEVVCEGLPTTILRPPKSSPLAAHIDSASLLELYAAWENPYPYLNPNPTLTLSPNPNSTPTPTPTPTLTPGPNP